jgi:hypothetical protein
MIMMCWSGLPWVFQRNSLWEFILFELIVIFHPEGEPISAHLLCCSAFAVEGPQSRLAGRCALHLRQPRLVNNPGERFPNMDSVLERRLSCVALSGLGPACSLRRPVAPAGITFAFSHTEF